jgi:hypothetical protein
LDNQEFKDTTWKTKHAIRGLVISRNLHMAFILPNKLIKTVSMVSAKTASKISATYASFSNKICTGGHEEGNIKL